MPNWIGCNIFKALLVTAALAAKTWQPAGSSRRLASPPHARRLRLAVRAMGRNCQCRPSPLIPQIGDHALHVSLCANSFAVLAKVSRN